MQLLSDVISWITKIPLIYSNRSRSDKDINILYTVSSSFLIPTCFPIVSLVLDCDMDQLISLSSGVSGIVPLLRRPPCKFSFNLRRWGLLEHGIVSPF